MNTSPWDYITSLGIQFYDNNDEKLTAGNKVCRPYEKLSYIDLNEEYDINSKNFVCNYQGCNIEFSSVLELEVHQWAKHTFVCNTCKGVFPSHHFLEIHILEFHDSYFEVAAKKNPMFLCLLEHCGKVFSTPQERKKHCIEEHKFPSDFRYDLKFKKLNFPRPENVDKYSSNKKKLKKVKEITSKTRDSNSEVEKMECTMIGEKQEKKQEMDVVSSSARVPKLVSFGTGIPRGFITKRGNKGKYWHQKNNFKNTRVHLDQISMNDLSETLDEMET